MLVHVFVESLFDVNYNVAGDLIFVYLVFVDAMASFIIVLVALYCLLCLLIEECVFICVLILCLM